MPHDPRARTALIILILSLNGTVAALNQTMVIPLLPVFPGILDTSADNAAWLVTITLLVGAVAMPTVTRLADMFGKRLMLVGCMGFTIVGSVLAALGTDFIQVLVGRGFQGFAMALIPIGISVMRDTLPQHRVATAVTLMSATLGVGGALGLPLSGVLYESFGWASIFWVSAAAGAVLMTLVLAFVPESAVRTAGRFDYTGALILSGALTAILLVISKGGSWGWLQPATLGVAVVGAVLLAIWVPHQLFSKRPLVDLRTSTSRPVLITNIAAVLLGFGMFGNMLLTTQHLQLPLASGYGFELSVISAGLCMLPGAVVLVLFSPLTGYLLRRFGGKALLIAGAMIMATGYVMRIYLFDSLVVVIVSAAVISAGTAIAYASMPTLIMAAVPVTQTASANGVNTLLRHIGTSAASASIAGLLATAASTVAGEKFPTWASFATLYWVAAVACIIAAGVVSLLPRSDVSRASVA